MHSIKSLFKSPSPQEIAARELEEAKRSLLEAQTAEEFARHTAAYHQERIERLSKYLEAA